MKKTLLTLLLSFISILWSCLGIFDPCKDILPYFTPTGLKITHLKYHKGSDTILPLEDYEPVKWEDYVMRVSLMPTFHAREGKSFGSAAYARDCMDNGGYGSKIALDTLYLITIKDYDSLNLKNDTINDLILVKNYRGEFALPLTYYISKNKSKIYSDMFEITLSKGPTTKSSSHFFKLVYHLSNGEILETTSKEVILKKELWE